VNDMTYGKDFFEKIFAEADPAERSGPRAPARLKSRTYSQLALRQAESGPLLSVSETNVSGRGLCVFEELARIAPFGEAFKRRNFCRACHARKLAEVLDKAPIYWAHCPYSEFQK
jgi:hypothetical protein